MSAANLRDRTRKNMDKTVFTNLFAPFDRANPTPAFRSLRDIARARFAKLPLPTTRTEDWRFTSIAPLLETRFELAPTIAADAPTPPRPELLRLLFVNGRFVPSLSPPMPAGVRIGALSQTKPEPTALAQIADADNVFNALNTSFLSDGAYIAISDNQAIERLIEVVHVAIAVEDGPVMVHPRVLVVLGRNARATVLERYLGDGVYFANAVTEISLGEQAVLDHVKVQEESSAAYHIANTQVVLSARSNITTHYLALGGGLVRNETRVRFDGERAEATVNGLYLGSGKQHIDNFTVIDHAKPNCASHELYKGILNDRAHGVFNGKIFVRKDAQKTDAKQTNKVLLLSDDATINTKPQLEIFADDVKCTHGATIGQLDANQLFYLQARGIPFAQARRLLTFAFANDIVGRIKIEAIREELEARIVQ